MPQNHLVISQGVQAVLDFGVGTIPTSVVIHYANPSSTPVDQAMANAVFNSLKALWVAHLAPLCPASTVFQGVRVRDINTAGQAIVPSNAAVAPGTDATGDTLPPQTAMCLTVRTSRAGRKYRGRMYFPGFSESSSGPDGRASITAKAALDAFAAGFIVAANVSAMTFGVAHRPTAFDADGNPVSPGLGFITPATLVQCRDNIWDTQRRRGRP